MYIKKPYLAVGLACGDQCRLYGDGRVAHYTYFTFTFIAVCKATCGGGLEIYAYIYDQWLRAN